MRSPAPPIWVRLAVTVGVVALAAGVLGSVHLLRLQGHVGLQTRVRVEGAPPSARLQVEVRWTEGDVEFRRRAVPGGTAGEWRLPPVPADRAVSIVAYDTGVTPPRVLAQQPLPQPPPPTLSLPLGFSGGASDEGGGGR